MKADSEGGGGDRGITGIPERRPSKQNECPAATQRGTQRTWTGEKNERRWPGLREYFFLLHAVMSRETEVTYSKDMFLVNYFFASRRVTTLLTDFNFHRIGEWRNLGGKNTLL